MWRGTAASWVDLTPAHRGYANARVNATYGGRHVGSAGNLGTPNLAFLWQDTAQSSVPLRPTGTFVSSEALGIHGNQQVGESFTINLFTGHATVWSGTSDSGVDLHPDGYATSRAAASNGLLQVGSAALGSGAAARLHAALWAGTADSFIDLHALLPAGRFEHSGAFAVDEAGNVYGTATGATGPTSFVVWSVVPEPSALVLAAVPAVAALRRRHTRRGSA